MPKRARPATPAPLEALRRPLVLTRAGMVLERGLRAFWPLLSLAALGFSAAAFRLQDHLTPGWLFAVLWATGAAIFIALVWGAWRFRWPARREAVARLDATLPGRPLTALSDAMVLGGNDTASRALWEAHLARMAARAAGARAVAPAPDLAPRDPFALRLTALTALVLALLFGAPFRVLDVQAPGVLGSAEAAMGPSWEGWAEPPRYTGKPGLYLNSLDSDLIALPEGSRMAFRFYGPAGAIPFEETVSSPAALPEAETGETLQKREFIIERSGIVEIGGPGGRRFEITALADETPSVALVGVAERRADGKLAQPFHAMDDYAVTSGRARVSLDLDAVPRLYGLALAPEPREDLVFDLPLPISGSRADFVETLAEDAARHPWANLPVKLTLEVEDGRGQTGSTGAQALELPGRRFFDPLASALIEARRDLLWSRENRVRVAQWLRAVSSRPDEFIPKYDIYLMLRMTVQRLETGPLTPEVRDEIAEALWQMAELLEDGGLADALAAMQQAQERLSEAIRNGASKDEIAKLMQELKEATDRYIQMLAERAQPEEGPQFGQQQPSQQITGDQIQQLMDEIQRLMEEGRMAEAQELLDQLARMMENLKVTQGQGGEGDMPGNQSMQDLAETLREQQKLSDDSFRQMQEGFGDGAEPEQPGEGEGEEGQGGTGADELAKRQQALRQKLGRQQGLMPRLGNESGDTARQQLDEAGRAMEEAEQALRDGDNGLAIDRQADAIEALREGMRSLGEALAEEAGRQQGNPGADGERRLGDALGGNSARELPRDPLGRSLGNGDRIGAQDEMLGADDVYRRARDLLDEIRRRSGERLRPEEELDYLRRLLDAF
ncbi:DUF4175 domain-containing protein [Sinirhodobacter sp. WL0062]|uniref:DUF4175 domain-containing protein n=1 Tax=Rhodobacter flavimaris TaxID=2907145 RepID=A0ABS8YUQ0_9RHOB|nr:DUF4175 domain-containing protein [Sinirhodobacter sp. WL0062]MCE5973584.1 DUF4175 domain-containing protein [Sinirhodobacter sp. WL0062]